MYKSIFLISTSKNNPENIKPGCNSSLNLLYHCLRLSNNQTASTIDSSLSYMNQVSTNKEPQWINFINSKNQHRIFKNIKKDVNDVLSNFKKELTERNKNYKNIFSYERIQTWKEWSANKKIISEWVLSCSKEWFIANKILANNKTSLIINDTKKMKEWVNLVNDWAKEKVVNFYGKHAYIATFLHIDESNIHLHFHYIRALLKMNNKEKKVAWALTNKDFINNKILKQIHCEYRSVIENYCSNNWTNYKHLSLLGSKIKYLKLLDYKIKSQRERLSLLNRQVIKQETQEINKYCTKNNDLVKKLTSCKSQKQQNELILKLKVVGYNDSEIKGILYQQTLSSL